MTTPTLHCGNLLDVLPTLNTQVDAVVTDPPYGLEFMGKEWDSFPLRDRGERLTGNGNPTTSRGFGGNVAYGKSSAALRQFGQWCEIWSSAALRVLKPGGYMLAMGGARTYHRLACAVEDAGFEVRDCLMWIYGQGFPKGKGCLKPAYEPILLCRRPGAKVLPLGIDECRVGVNAGWSYPNGRGGKGCFGQPGLSKNLDVPMKATAGRWPANIVHDGSDEVMERFAEFGERASGGVTHQPRRSGYSGFVEGRDNGTHVKRQPDTGTAARFFYCAKASRSERGDGNNHPTVKPLALMRWLVRLVCPPGGVVLDPFLGSGTTAKACKLEGRECIGIEQDKDYYQIAVKRSVS